MSIKIGREPQLGVGLETTPGTAVVESKSLPFVTCTMRGMQEPIIDEAAKGVREKSWGAITGKKHGEGDIEIYADVENAPYLLIPALGTVSTTSSSGVYVHTITRKSSNPPKTLSVIYNDTQDTRLYSYATVNTLELTVTDGLATISANILSKFPTSATASNSITSERILAFKDYTVKFGGGANGTAALAAANAATATTLTGFTLNINNNAEVQYESGTNDVAQISMGELEVGGNYTLFYESTTDRVHYETLLNGANVVRAMVITFTGGSIGSGETEEIKIEIPNFILTDRSVDTAVSGFITENPTFNVMYDPTVAYSVKVTVTNETASYN
jgi:hypothetical protein